MNLLSRLSLGGGSVIDGSGPARARACASRAACAKRSVEYRAVLLDHGHSLCFLILMRGKSVAEYFN